MHEWKSVLRQVSLSIALATSIAWGHSQEMFDLRGPSGDGIYFWDANGYQTIWQESNGVGDQGMLERWRSGWPVLHTGAATGLQMHNVCYGTFPDLRNLPEKVCSTTCQPQYELHEEPGPDCLNKHHSPDLLFTYLPWGYFEAGRWIDGSKEDCEESWGGVFVPRDDLLYAAPQTMRPPYSHDNMEAALLSHINLPATNCFENYYGQEVPPCELECPPDDASCVVCPKGCVKCREE